MSASEYVKAVSNESQTRTLAADFARCVKPGTTISLNATLGAGKTRFVQAFSESCGVPAGAVVSPTYVICQQYPGTDFTIYHLDVYRLGSEDEFLQLGSEEMFANSGVKLIEWGEQVVDCLPHDRVDIQIVVTGEMSRTFLFRAWGEGQTIIDCLNINDTTIVYKIVPASLWKQAIDKGVFDGAEIDKTDGFIHFSAEHQVAATAAKHFDGQTDLLLVSIPTTSLDQLKWEPSRGGDLFPHLYAALATDAASHVEPLETGLERLASNSPTTAS